MNNNYDVYMCRERKSEWSTDLTDSEKIRMGEYFDALQEFTIKKFRSFGRYSNAWLEKSPTNG
jgi:hypothetical protein